MHIAAVLETERRLLPSLGILTDALEILEKENTGIVKSGRTHLQDATPISFSQEISGWKSSLLKDAELIKASLSPLRALAIGATATGTGLNAPEGFDSATVKEISKLTDTDFYPAENKFHALTSKDELVFAHGALKALACDLMKIANDVRWLASGPRCGLGEIFIPENEPGSSIMPGKVNPTQCEAVTMVAVQVMANDTAVSMSASQGNFELNVFMPVCIYNYLQSVRLLSDVCISFEKNCVRGIKPNKEKMRENLYGSLMTVTALTPHIGYENAARAVHLAHEKNVTLKEACVALGYLSPEEFDRCYHPERMI
jgi:fumarate hydratase class II